MKGQIALCGRVRHLPGHLRLFRANQYTANFSSSILQDLQDGSGRRLLGEGSFRGFNQLLKKERLNVAAHVFREPLAINQFSVGVGGRSVFHTCVQNSVHMPF